MDEENTRHHHAHSMPYPPIYILPFSNSESIKLSVFSVKHFVPSYSETSRHTHISNLELS